MDGILTWISKIIDAGFWGPLSVLIGVSCAVLIWLLPPPVPIIRRYVNSPHAEDREWLRQALGDAPPFVRYKLAVRPRNEWLKSILGPRKSAEALAWCFPIAVFYPIALFLFGWLAGGQVVFEGLDRFIIRVPEASFMDRLSRLVMIAVVTFSCYLILSRLGHMQEATLAWLNKYFSKATSTPPPIIIKILGGAVTVAVVGVIAVVVTFLATFLVTHLVYVALPVSEIIAAVCAGAAAITVVGSIVIGSVVAGSIVVFSADVPEALALLIAFFLFYLILPMLVWGSSAVAHFFLAKTARTEASFPGRGLLFIELFTDLAVAALVLVLLVFLLPLTIEILNLPISLLGGQLLDWTVAVQTALRDPLGEGLFVVGMLVTTVVPTFLHLVAGLGGAFFVWKPNARAIAAEIPFEPLQDEQEELAEVDKDRYIKAVRQVRYWYFPASFAVLAMFFLFYWAFGLIFEPFGQFLADSAYCGGALVNSVHRPQCPWW